MPTTKHRIVNHVLANVFATVVDPVPAPIHIQLTKLRADKAKFDQAWSEMALRNLMADMVRSLKVMKDGLADQKASACDSAMKTIEKAMRGHSPRRARYDNALCFGYRVKTAGDKFSGHTDEWSDMKARCDDMIAAIQAAYGLSGQGVNHNTDPKMLKIFMAPEFFFRGKNGAYDHTLVGGESPRQLDGGAKVPAKPGLMDLLNAEIGKPIYKDWLFVLGSVIAATKYSTTVCNICSGAIRFDPDPANPGRTKGVCKTNAAHIGTKERVDGAMVDNISIVVKESTTYTSSKELVSHIDFVTDEKAGIRNKVTVKTEELDVFRSPQASGYDAASEKATKFSDERMGGSIFTVDGITFGLEVCLDHAATRASSDTGRLDHAANVQVQLIPSAGMSIGSVSTVKGGIVFNVDGSTPHVQCVGGGDTPELRYDIVSPSNDQYQLRYPDTVDFDNVGSFDTLSNTKSLNQWNWLATPPKVANGASGSVLMYGPYPLP